MNIHIHVDSMKAAEDLSSICKEFGTDITLCSEKFHIDPKSTLGILAMMYSARNSMYLDISELDENLYPKFLTAIDSFIVPDPQ